MWECSKKICTFPYLVEVFAIERIYLWQVDMSCCQYISDFGVYLKNVFFLTAERTGTSCRLGIGTRSTERCESSRWFALCVFLCVSLWCKYTLTIGKKGFVYHGFRAGISHPSWHTFEAFDSSALYSLPGELSNSLKFVIQYISKISRAYFMSVSTKDTLGIAFLERAKHWKKRKENASFLST